MTMFETLFYKGNASHEIDKERNPDRHKIDRESYSCEEAQMMCVHCTKDYSWNDLFEWVGEHHWELVMFHNGVQIVEKSFIKEYLTKNLIVRIQDNASVSIALRTLTHICGLFCGDIFEVSNINDTNCFLSKPYEYKVRTIVRSTSNYDKFIENL